MKKSFVLTCLGLSLLLCNCATVFTGSRQTIQIDSEPAGAEVLVDGVHMGETPTPVRVKKQFRGQLITLKADGYETKNSARHGFQYRLGDQSAELAFLADRRCHRSYVDLPAPLLSGQTGSPGTRGDGLTLP